MNTTRFARKGAQRSWSELGEKRSVHKVTDTALSCHGGIDVKDHVLAVMNALLYQPPSQTAQLGWHQWQNSFPQKQ
ncbi:hypothetical protein FQN60_001641 [Etheostoma spectabile]|uniref:Uncharacterized protein n=1 Tax=Etheostoma spectabile TaxID=54343 RepID=A0A5J5D346_9PERO|nr:hypothetical protein FQN60_001641 [Etheostoma spectabile]